MINNRTQNKRELLILLTGVRGTAEIDSLDPMFLAEDGLSAAAPTNAAMVIFCKTNTHSSQQQSESKLRLRSDFCFVFVLFCCFFSFFGSSKTQ